MNEKSVVNIRNKRYNKTLKYCLAKRKIGKIYVL